MKVIEADHVILGAGIVGVWLARRLLRIGKTVVLVDIGPSEPSAETTPIPEICFAERENIGATQARNQGLTGNSRFWGGGLIRNDDDSLCRMFGFDGTSDAVEDFLECYQAVEHELNLPDPERFKYKGSDFLLSKIAVLPGSRRNIVGRLLEPFRNDQRLKIFSETEVEEFRWCEGSRISGGILSLPSGDRLLVKGKHYVLSMGVIDSNIFALKHLSPVLGEPGRRIATRLHDHWSIPLAKCKWKNGSGLGVLFPPAFLDGFVQGARMELAIECPWGIQVGFLHVQAQYDQIEPYATIKGFLSARQRGCGWVEQAKCLLPLVIKPIQILQLAYGRFVRRRLFVPDGVELNLILDFESFPSKANKITQECGKFRLYWDVRDEDIISFAAFVDKSRPFIQSMENEGDLEFDFLVDGLYRQQLEDYLRRNVIDAYHLGGGLAVDSSKADGVLDQDFGVQGVQNLSVISTAAFANPGVANPVETLLAMCERYVRSVY